MRITKFILSLIVLITIASCQTPKTEIANTFLNSINQKNKIKIAELLDDNFIYIKANGDSINKTEYLNNLDSAFNLETRIKYKELMLENDNYVTYYNTYTNIIDSLLEIEPKISKKERYYIEKDKIITIITDSIENQKEYQSQIEEQLLGFSLYLDEEDPGNRSFIIDIKNSLSNYASLTPNKRSSYITVYNLLGRYYCKTGFYRKLIFKGRTTVVIIDSFFGMQYPTSYVIDGKYIRIRTDKSDLILRIKDSNTLIGEGWAKGVYRKSKHK